jgi:hypothetical protein
MLGQQVTKTVVLTWDDPVNPSTVKYQVYKATGACDAPGLAWAKLGGEVSEKTYTEGSVPIGRYCYRVTSIGNGVESAPSNTAEGTVPPAAPGGLSITVQVSVLAAPK